MSDQSTNPVHVGLTNLSTSDDSKPPCKNSEKTVVLKVEDGHFMHDKSIKERSVAAFKEEIARAPRKVFIRFKVFDINAIYSTDGTVKVDFAIYLRWFDQSCIKVQKKDFGRTAAEYEQLWHPGVEVNNNQGLTEVWDADTSWNLKDYETGEVKYSQRYRGLISNEMDLRNFPFDSDVIGIAMGPKFYKEDKVIFEHDPDFRCCDTAVSSRLEDWSVATPVTVDFKTGKFGHRNVVLNMVVHRKSGYYLWKVLLINLLAGMFSWYVFLMPASDISDRINTTLTLFLAEVAFLFVIADKLPQVSYLTVMDRIILGSFVLLFLTAFETMIAYSFVAENKFFSSKTGPDNTKAEAVDMFSAIAFPISFVALHVACVWRAIWKRKQLVGLGAEAKTSLKM
mmetsp:Transcript_17245/g.34577  ORF Transcript_17245/g.34577 Transcript_17245/m.34577 type:complete len:396 (-) Transcript_17245:91-1278(-)